MMAGGITTMVGWLWAGAALAAPVGDPVSHRSEGIGALGVSLGGEAIGEQDTDCTPGEDTACDGVWRRGGGSLVGRLTLVEGVGLDVELGRLKDRVQQANYRGQGVHVAGGLRVAVPVGGGWWLAGVGRYERGQADGSSGEDVERSRYQQGLLTGLLVWDAPNDNGFAVWAGAQGAALWEHHVVPLGEDDAGTPILDISLGPSVPVAGVLGLGLTSDSLGPPWGAPLRMAIDLDLLIGQSNGVHGQMRLLF